MQMVFEIARANLLQQYRREKKKEGHLVLNLFDTEFVARRTIDQNGEMRTRDAFIINDSPPLGAEAHEHHNLIRVIPLDRIKGFVKIYLKNETMSTTFLDPVNHFICNHETIQAFSSRYKSCLIGANHMRHYLFQPGGQFFWLQSYIDHALSYIQRTQLVILFLKTMPHGRY